MNWVIPLRETQMSLPQARVTAPHHFFFEGWVEVIGLDEYQKKKLLMYGKFSVLLKSIWDWSHHMRPNPGRQRKGTLSSALHMERSWIRGHFWMEYLL